MVSPISKLSMIYNFHSLATPGWSWLGLICSQHTRIMPIPNRFSTPLGIQRLDPHLVPSAATLKALKHLTCQLGQRPSLRGSSNDRVSGSTAAPKVSPAQWTRTLQPFGPLTFKYYGETWETKRGTQWKLLIQATFRVKLCENMWKHVKTARTPHLHEVLNQVLPAKSLQGLSPILKPKTRRPGPQGCPGAGLGGAFSWEEPLRLLRCQRVVSLTRPKDSMQPGPLDPLDPFDPLDPLKQATRPVEIPMQRWNVTYQRVRECFICFGPNH